MKRWPWHRQRTRLRDAQAADRVDPPGAIPTSAKDQIQAGPADVTKHVNSLWQMTFRQMAQDGARDPSDSNIAIVRLVADMRLARVTKWVMLAGWGTVMLTGVGIIIAIVVH